MPKRSQNPGNHRPKKIDAKNVNQLNRAIDVMLTRADGNLGKLDASIEPLVRIAADLRELPREDFKERLKAKLTGRKNMSTVAEPIVSTRTSASPRLTFKDAAKAIEFYKQAFGATEIFRFETGSGIPHAEISIGDSTIMLTEEWPEGGRFSAETVGQSPVWLTLQVPDVDAFTARALAAGAKVTIPIRDQFYGRREGSVLDPFGYTWSISTVKEVMSVDEMHRRMASATGPTRHATKPDVNQVPRGLRMITPYLVAENGLALLDFAQQAFGAKETLRALMPNGVHGEVRMGDSSLMIGGGIPGHKFPGSLQPQALHIYVEDADAVTRKAVAAGATLIDGVRDQEYGERSSTVKDAAGNFWYIATHKGESHVPKGLYNVNPYLHPLRAEPLIGFLKRAFGAQEEAKYASPDGVVHHAVIRVGDAVVEMGEAHGKYEPMQAMFYVYVPNCDAVYRQAVAAGATSFQEPTDQPYGDRNAGVQDNFGNKWYIATHVKDVAV